MYRELPGPVSGYEILPQESIFGIIVPHPTTNLAFNPSFEAPGTPPYSGTNVNLSITQAAATRGAVGWEIESGTVPASASNAFIGLGVLLTDNETYTISIDIKRAEGNGTVELGIRDDGGNVIFTKPIEVKPYVTRVSVTGVITATGATEHFLYLLFPVAEGTSIFYVDGMQVEHRSYATTYCDGDQPGCTWIGKAHLSQSYRPPYERGGGLIKSLKDDFGFRLASMQGLGMPPAELSINAYALLDGGFYDRTRYASRPFSLVGQFSGGSLAELMRQKSALAQALQRNHASPDSPVYLVWQRDQYSPPYLLRCLYAGGLEANYDNYHVDRTAIQFIMPTPHLEGWLDNSAQITPIYSDVQAGAGTGIVCQDENGEWGLFPEESDAFNECTAMLAYGNGGLVFAAINGGTDLYLYNMVERTRLLVCQADAAINVIAADPNGNTVYIGGAFTDIDGNPFNRIASFDASTVDGSAVTFTALAGGADDNSVLAVTIDNSGNVYIGGTFTAVDGATANTARIARFTGGAWFAMQSGANGTVYSMDLWRGVPVIGGAFTNIDNATGTVDYLCTWEEGDFRAIGGLGSPNAAVRVVRAGKDRTLYVGGEFTTVNDGNVIAAYIAYYSTQWRDMNIGLAYHVYDIQVAQNGWVYVAGKFTDGVIISPIVAWNGSRFIGMPVGLNDSYEDINPGDSGVLIDHIVTYLDRSLALAWRDDSLDLIFVPAATVVTIDTPSQSYPTLRISAGVTGSTGYLYWIENFTTGGFLALDRLPISNKEFVDIIFKPERVQIISNFRGDVSSYILAGSTPERFFLLAGQDNYINCMHSRSEEVDRTSLIWRDRNLLLPV